MATSEPNMTLKQLANRAMQGAAQLRERLQCHVLLSSLQAIQRRLTDSKLLGHPRLRQSGLVSKPLQHLRELSA